MNRDPLTNPLRPEQWIVSGETGLSSRAIWAVMMGAVIEPLPRFGYPPPRDPDDFRRCLLLFSYFPEWRVRIGEVAEKFPEWRPVVAAWGDIERVLYDELLRGEAPETYAIIATCNRPDRGTP